MKAFPHHAKRIIPPAESALRILFVGGIFYVEYSLYKESLNNPNLDVMFCTASTEDPTGLQADVDLYHIHSMGDVETYRREFKPDLVIFRNFMNTELWAKKGDVVWIQEKMATQKGEKYVPGTYLQMYRNQRMTTEAHIATQSKVEADAQGCLYLPYCVSKYWEKSNPVKDIDIMCATYLPGTNYYGRALKIEAIRDTVLPLALDRDLLKRFKFYTSYDPAMTFFQDSIQRPFKAIEAIDYTSRAKIVICPSTVQYDPGYLSHKILQSMACGAMVITNPQEGLQDIFGVSGNYLYCGVDASEFEDVLNDVDSDIIGREAYRFVHENFAWEPHLNRLYKETANV